MAFRLSETNEMSAADLLGYIASALVVLTFYMKEMAPLRAAALCSNVCFLGYGLCLHLGPVVLLHTALIPINLVRLVQSQPSEWQSIRLKLSRHAFTVLKRMVVASLFVMAPIQVARAHRLDEPGIERNARQVGVSHADDAARSHPAG
jgi:hypothetical protein